MNSARTDAPTGIDLNSDLGEGFAAWAMGDDEAMLQVVTSANIACGAHAGDASIMRRRCESAVANGVRIGAHIGHRDLSGFGRRRLDVDARTIEDEALHQIGALSAAATAAGDRVRYVKPHGALYHQAAEDAPLAAAIVSAMRILDPALVLLGPPASELDAAARDAGIRFVAEGYADRRYGADGRLVDRSRPDALLSTEEAIEQSLALAAGAEGHPRFASICVHGDTPGAVGMAQRVRARLLEAGIAVTAFA